MAKSKGETKISPRGVFMFPHLITPDFNFKEEFGEYNVCLRVPSGEAQELVEEIDAALEAKYVAESNGKKVRKKNLPYKIDEETDEVVFTFKKNAAFKDSKTGEVVKTSIGIKTNTSVDGKLQDHDRDVPIWGGTIGRIAFTILPYEYKGSVGVRLNLNSVKILKLVSGSNDADLFGDEDADFTDADDDINEAQGFAKHDADDDADPAEAEGSEDGDF